ncbi:Vps51/Vps67 domain-containing protein [Mycena albidolilacea]|uniref:Conserved oligomeric Golgi complex subunit 1 n=1 Tax=Mycena albidolilacea TaxID=1033008 RepID=A0AAD7ALZ2_9AGAR|nr:Vps51/Vps67 domain-containing protein [Mycena albidolilacea]
MSRRPSALSVSLPAPLANGTVKAVQSPTAPEAPASTRRPSVSKLPTDISELDPDELFTKYTVAEVKFAQQRLRADADAKQEELRLMLRERYRDLLQASTSIIDIARSSKRVIEALQETKDAILSQEEPPMPQRTSGPGGGDAHLHTLQLLSAHLKLLLDAPEYLWRLIERKKYFTAAWLFQLAGMVHRALDKPDEETWSAQGLDVMEQFPLAQRQWDAVSQFRSQIVHKATLSLREYAASAEDACAAILTLHFLDRRPLTETLSVFLSQRSKTLLTMLSRTAEHSPISPLSPSLSRRANGHIPEKRPAPSTARKTSVREVKEATQAALDAMVKTLTTARSIFEEAESRQSMIGAVLEFIQSDSASPDPNSKTLPLELELTTQSLLATLPSSTHFLLLPPALRSYKPYVDLSSSSSLVEHVHFRSVLDEWFQTSNQSLKVAASKWFSDLHSVAEVWTLRSSIRQWIDASGLRPDEATTLKLIFGDAAQQRVLSIWKLALSNAEDAFQLQLAAATASLRETPREQRKDASPVDFPFTAPPLPVFPGLGPVDSSFQKYKASLRRQLIGRTSLLDSVLATLESCARSLQRDLSVVLGGNDEEARGVVAQLSEDYRPNAEALCIGILDTLSSAEKQDADDSYLSIDSLVFVGHVAEELGSSSPFVSTIGGSAEVVQDFKKRTKALHDRIIDRWRTYIVSRIVDQHRAVRPKSKAPPADSAPSTPSADLVESLLILSSSVQDLGFSRSRAGENTEASKTLRLFINQWVGDGWKQTGRQALCDMAFLRRLADLRTPEWQDVCQLLDSKAQRYREQLQQESTSPLANGWNDGAADYLARTQTLFAALLPPQSPTRPLNSADKFAPLLPWGSPALDQQFQPAVELAKASSRFGLLLVGTSAR